jgi:YD repeat-containing protein
VKNRRAEDASLILRACRCLASYCGPSPRTPYPALILVKDWTLTYTMDRLITKATPEGTLTYTYDGDSHVLSITSSNANGASVSCTYDCLNRLSTVMDNRLGGSQNTTTYTYDTANNLVTETLPNNLQSTFQYDPENRLSSMTAG